mgnify:CR=1 FL=1
MSKTAAVEKVFSSDESQQTKDVNSSTSRNLPLGTFESIICTCSLVIWSNILVFAPAGVIALTAIFAIVVLPKILPLISPDAHVIVGYTEWKPGFLFFEGKDVMQWVPMAHKGIVITPLDTNLVAAIIGLYFGGSLVKK